MKDKLFNTTKYVLALTAMLQLAMSQVHISVITKVFALQIGFYFFLFIIFGLVTLLNAVNARTKNNGILMSVCTLAVLASGIKYIQYLLADVKTGNVLTYSDITFVLYFTVISLVIYVIGTVILIVTKSGLSKRSI